MARETAAFLALPIENIGQLSGGKTKRTGLIDVAVIQSLQHKGAVEDFVADYGHVIVDECHHLSAVTFERVLREVKAKYVLGLTATPLEKMGTNLSSYAMRSDSFSFKSEEGRRVFSAPA